VIDAGRGFDEAATGRDRLGLRTSVRSRIASVGGRVQVWSAPGRGTSVLLQVPDGTGAPVASEVSGAPVARAAPAVGGVESVPSGDQR
jgi:signal transduction histidine kinase